MPACLPAPTPSPTPTSTTYTNKLSPPSNNTLEPTWAAVQDGCLFAPAPRVPICPHYPRGV